MANGFNKNEIVAFEDILMGFNDALILSKMVNKYSGLNAQQLERAGDTVWRPQPYVAQSFDGMDQTANLNRDNTQLAVPASLGFSKASLWNLTAKELNDQLQEGSLGTAARQKLASDINVAVNAVASNQGTLVVKRTAAASGFDDIAQAEAIMNEQGVMMDDRYAGLSTRDYNSAASNLANRTLDNSKSLTAYERSFIGRLASFDTFKMDYTPRLNAAVPGAGVTITAATFYVPRATSTATTGEVGNVDNRFQSVGITVGAGGTVKVGDAFTIAGVNAVHHITKADTGQLKTFRITAIVTGAGGTGTVQISPPIISGGGATDAELQYKNVTASAAAGAAVTFLNTASAFANPFFHKSAIELMPGHYSVPTDAGAAVMRASTDQGLELVMQKQYVLATMKTNFRIDLRFGVTMLQPEMAGILLFGQP